MKKSRVIKESILVLIGSFILAVSTGIFTLPFEIVLGGTSGLAVAINAYTGFDVEMLIYLIMGINFLLAWLILGVGSAMKAILSTISYPLFLSLIKMLDLPAIEISQVLAALYAGVIGGIGIGIIFRNGGSSGGMDIPPLIVHKYTKISVSKLMFAFDFLVLLAGVIVFGISSLLVGLIGVFSFSITIDKVLTSGGNKASSVFIISEKDKEINEAINFNLNRGSTILHGQGGYSNKKFNILFVALPFKQYPKLYQLVKDIDEDAFMVVSDAHEIRGEGFSE